MLAYTHRLISGYADHRQALEHKFEIYPFIFAIEDQDPYDSDDPYEVTVDRAVAFVLYDKESKVSYNHIAGTKTNVADPTSLRDWVADACEDDTMWVNILESFDRKATKFVPKTSIVPITPIDQVAHLRQAFISKLERMLAPPTPTNIPLPKTPTCFHNLPAPKRPHKRASRNTTERQPPKSPTKLITVTARPPTKIVEKPDTTPTLPVVESTRNTQPTVPISSAFYTTWDIE